MHCQFWRIVLPIVTFFLVVPFSTAQTATYHLHKEASTIDTTFDQLETAGPDASSVALTNSLTNKTAGDYVIKEFETQTGVPNSPGVIPSGSTLSFSLWMRKTANAPKVTVKPEARVRLNSATGTSLCGVTGSTALTIRVTMISLSCKTTAAIAMTTSDRFYLWVGVNISAQSSRTYSGELDIEGALNGNFDSQVTLPVPSAGLTPTGLSFANQIVNTTSTAQAVTLKNNQSTALAIAGIATSGDYGQSNDCGTSLAAGASCTINVVFNPTSTGTRTGILTVTDNGNDSPQTALLSGTGIALTSISVTPATPSIPKGTTQQFTAIGTYSDGSQQNLTALAAWSSSNTAIASVSTSGLATGVGQGTTTITTTAGTISGSTTLTVAAPALVSLAVTPSNPSVAKGLTQQFTATGTYTDNSTQNLTFTAAWTSSATSIATINSAGLASTLAQGTSTITATSGTISGSTTLTITAPVLASIAVTPANPSVPKGSTQQFTATGTYTDNSTQNLTATASWSSSATGIATISSAGLATTVAQGTSAITATLGTISGSTALTVTAPALVSIVVTPANTSVAKGLTQQFTATGTYTDNSVQDLTSTATWTSSATTIATINSSGLATAVAQGTGTITATSGSVSGSTTLTVTAPALVSIAVTPTNPSAPKGSTQQFTATGTYTDNSTQDLTSTATWTSSATAIATVNSSGLATTLAQGTSTIAATSGSVSGSTTLTVTAPALVSIAVMPVNPSVPRGSTQQFTATGTYTDNSTQDLTGTAIWSSSATTIATINSSGLATAVAQGTITITATSSPVSGSTTLTVTAPALVSIALTPANPSVPKGSTQQFTATGTYTDNGTQDLSSTATWTSSATTIATINSSGLATAVAQGTSTITATSGSVSGSTTLTVTTPALVSIAVTPANPSVPKGSTQQFTAIGTYADNSTQDLTSTATWTASATTIATINSSGLATAVAQGSSTITATSGSVSGSTTLTVTAPALVSIAVTPVTPTISLNATQQFTATGTYTDASTQDLTGSVTWTSLSTAVATIDGSGLATGMGAGASTITASFGTISASTTLTVLRQPTSITISPTNVSIAQGSSQQFTATANYSDGSMQDVTSTAVWASSLTNIATVSSTGLATTLNDGVTTISVTVGSSSASATLTVTPPSVVSIAVTPFNPSIPIGATQQFIAIGTFSNGSTQDVTATATWTSSSTSAVTMSGTGLATAVGPGKVVVSATSGHHAGLTSLTVITPPTSLTFAPATVVMLVGTTRTLSLLDQNGNPVVGATWTVDNTTIATLSTADPPLLTAVNVGTATVTASINGLSTQATVNVLLAGANGGLPAGTVLWSAPRTPGSTGGAILQAVPTGNNTPDLFFFESTGVRGFTADGQQLWATSISGQSAIPDGAGGALVLAFDSSGQESMTHLDGVTGSPTWQISERGTFNGYQYLAVHPDGTIYHPFSDRYPGNSYPVVTALDGNTGTTKPGFPILPPGFVYENGAASPVSIMSDGSGYVTFETDSSNMWPDVTTLQLLKFQSDGSYTVQQVDSEVSNPPIFYSYAVGSQTIIPDGQGGVLVAWQLSQINGHTQTVHDYVTHVPAGGSPNPSYDLPYGLDNGVDNAAYDVQMVLGDNNAAFISGRNRDNAYNLVAFDVNSGAVKWTWQAPVGHKLALVAASADGGVVAKDIDQSGNESIVRFDAAGSPTYDTPQALGVSVSPSWGGDWNLISTAGAFSEITLPPVAVDGGNVWSTPRGNPSENGMAVAQCPCLFQSASSANSNSIPMFVSPNAQSAPATPTINVMLVGDPGLNDHNVGNLFDLAAQTLSDSLIASGNNVVVTNRISSVQDFNNGLTNNGSINGRVTYFGHAGWALINGQLHAALFVGQQAGANTNVTDLNVNLLSNAQLGPNAIITLNGCHAGYGGPYSIAEQIALQLKRKVYAYKVGMFFSADPKATRPGAPPPGHTPIYMLPLGGSKIQEFPIGGIH